MQDLAFAIPGVDEAMGFAEIMKWVKVQVQATRHVHLSIPHLPTYLPLCFARPI